MKATSNHQTSTGVMTQPSSQNSLYEDCRALIFSSNRATRTVLSVNHRWSRKSTITTSLQVSIQSITA